MNPINFELNLFCGICLKNYKRPVWSVRHLKARFSTKKMNRYILPPSTYLYYYYVTFTTDFWAYPRYNMSLLEFHLHSTRFDLCRNSGKFCEWPDSVENIFKKSKYAVVDKSTRPSSIQSIPCKSNE